MLPSTGKFKEINCPFFDSGLCERPYCHFRHVKRETSEILQTPASTVSTVNPTLALGENGEILQQLVSEAVRKVLEQTDLPSALARPSGSNAVESVSRNLVTKVAEVLAPPLAASASSQQTYSVSAPQSKVPSYKPTPISVLKNRHIPIPYSPSLTKSSTVLRKRSSSDESSALQKKLKKQELEESSKTSVSYLSTSLVSKGYEPNIGSSVNRDCVSNSTSDSSQYSPAPVKGWKDNGFKYTPSAIETLKPNTYVPSSSTTVQLSVAEYEPTEKSDSAVEPTYEPLATNGSAIGSASYEPSRVSNSEPEYQPLCCDNTAKEYVPTDISKLESNVNIDLDISPEIDLLHDLLHDELNGSDSEDTEREKSKVVNKIDSGSRNEIHSEHLDCDEKASLIEKSKGDNEKQRSDNSKKKGSEKKKNGDKKRTEYDRKEDSKKESETNKRKNSSKRKCDSKKQGETFSSSSNKKRTENDKKKDDGDKKKSESRRKSEYNENERKKSDVKKASLGKKHCEHRKKTENDKKKGDTEKKKSENEVKKSESDKKKCVSGKESNSDKSFSNTHDSKQSASSEHKNSEKNSCSVHSEHRQSSAKSVSEKKSNENRKQNHHSRKKHLSGHSINSHLKQEGKLKKSEEYSKSKNANLKCKSDAPDHIHIKKTKSSHKHSKSESNKKHGGVLLEEISLGNSVSDSEGSDVTDILDNVTLPNDTWASSSDEETVTKECYRIFQEYEPNNVVKKPKPQYQPPQLDEDEVPVPGKRRVAHEGAQNSKLFRNTVRRPAAPNPSQVLSERFQRIRATHAQTQALNQAQIQAQAHAQTQALNQAQIQAQAHAQTQTQAHLHVQAQTFAHQQLSIGSPPSVSQKRSDMKSPSSQPISASSIAGGRKRIAHVPNVSILLDAKLKMQQKLKEQQMSVESAGKDFGSSTKAQTVPKGAQRVAHMPSEQVLTRPVVKGLGGKIPSNVRQNYLNILVDEYLKISSSDQEAYEKAEEEEKSIYSRSTTRAVYTSHVSNTINRLRKAAQNSSASTSGKIDGKVGNRTVSHTSMLAGKVGSKGSWSIEKPRKPPASVVNKSLYESLSQFIMSEELLQQNGFPMGHAEEKGVAVIHNFYKKPFIPKTPSQRMCARCSRIYYVNQQGHAVKEELCVYHWGRLFQSKTRGGWEARYNCCQGHGDAIGCSVGNCHVSDNFDPNNLRGFVKTLPKEKPPPDGNYGVYALDCEMSYTTLGLELTRVTVIGTDLNVVYESLVKPESTILDYNTRFSGIQEDDLVNVTTNIYEVQSVLLSFINDKTILIGHSLESDFKALKLIHSTVVDTSVVYPHKMGPPKKRALKTLCRDLLRKIIQESDGGHDSAEDARAAMEIMLFKVKEDMKTAW